MATVETPTSSRRRETLDQAVIRFCGDSGDGMQITGGQFTNTAAVFGNDLATFPDFPAEIRAPAGTLPGVSGFQLHFASRDVFTPGDSVDVLIAMNPAALRMNIADLKTGGVLIVSRTSTSRRRSSPSPRSRIIRSTATACSRSSWAS
jgi:2-oxoglutarate/2-oxoacid ferredoxin oxidoreductase subunit alpha